MAVIACLVLRENSNLKFQSNLNFLSWFEASAVAATAVLSPLEDNQPQY